MSNLLNCIDLVRTYESLGKILGHLGKFILQNSKRITCENGYYWRYDNLTIQDVKSYFNKYEFDFDEIAIYHVVAIINKESYMEKGLLNLGSLAKDSNNDFTNFLKEFGISFRQDREGNPDFEYNGIKISSDYVQHRLQKDQCINGFLLGESCLLDTNVSAIRECPEIIAHISREVINLPNLRNSWMQRAIPSFVSFKVKIEQIDSSTFNKDLSIEEKKEFFLLKSIEYLLFKHTHYPLENPMIYLKENINVCPERIMSITELKNDYED
jgi:hypothetical protein